MSAAEQKNKPAFLYFDNKSISNYKNHILFDFNEIMRNVGGEEYSYESFKELCNNDSAINELVDEYNKDGIILNQSEEPEKKKDKSDTEKPRKKAVSNAAKRAAKKSINSEKL